MADTVARASLQIDTNAEAEKRSVDDLASSFAKLDTEMDAVGTTAPAVSSGITSTGTASANAVGGLTRLAAGLVSVELAKRALMGTTRLLVAGLREYGESNAAAGRQVAALSDDATALKNDLLDAAFGGGRFEEIMGVSRDTLEALTTAVKENEEWIRQIIDAGIEWGGNLADIIRFLSAVGVELGKYREYANLIVDLANPFDELKSSIGGVLGVLSGEQSVGQALATYASDLSGLERILDDTAGAQDTLTDAIEGTGSAVANTSPSFSLYAQAWGMISDGMDLAEASSRSYSSGAREAEQATKDLDAAMKALANGIVSVQEAQKNSTDLTLEDLARLSEGYKEAMRLQAEKQAADLRASTMGTEEGGPSIDDKASEAIKAAQQRLDAFKATIRDSAAEIAQSGMTESLGMIGEMFGALASGDEDFAKNFGKNSLKLLGKMISSFGQVLIAQGIGISIADPMAGGLPNPARGGAAIGAGAAAVVLGSALGYAGGGKKGGGRGGGGGMAPQAAAPVQNTFNLNSSVGMVGDTRAFGREISYQSDRARRMGYT